MMAAEKNGSCREERCLNSSDEEDGEEDDEDGHEQVDDDEDDEAGLWGVEGDGVLQCER